MYNAMNPTVYHNILAKFGIHPQKMAHAVGATGMGSGSGAAFGGQPPADPHGGGGAIPLPNDPHGGTPPAGTPTPNPGMPHVTASMGGMTAGQPPADNRTGGGPAGQYGTSGPGQTPPNGYPNNFGPPGQYGTTGPAGQGQSLFAQPPAAGQLPPWLQNLLALMR